MLATTDRTAAPRVLDEAVSALRAAISRVRAAAASASAPEREHLLREVTRAQDELAVVSLELLDRPAVLEGASGLPAELLLTLSARRTSADAHTLLLARSALSAMPRTREALRSGLISWPQARAVVRAVRRCDAAVRDRVDALVGREAPRLRDADPDELVHLVDELVAHAREDLAAAREERAVRASFLAIQPSLDGLRGTLFAEGDAASIATIAEGLDAVMPPPPSRDDPHGLTRAQQRFDALLGLCEGALAGESAQVRRTRPRPRVLLSVDARDLAAGAERTAAQALWQVAGRAPRLSALATDVALCDAQVLPVVFDGARPVATGSASTAVPDALRTALVARDRGCRFPGCHAPAAWTDAHHIVHRAHGGPTTADNLLLLCRRCHRRIHRHRWKIALLGDGTISFTLRGATMTSPPRAGPLRE